MKYSDKNKNTTINYSVQKDKWEFLRTAAKRVFATVISSYVLSLLYCYIFLDGQEEYNTWFDITLLLPVLGVLSGYFIVYGLNQAKISDKSTLWKVLLVFFLIVGMGIPMIIGGYYQFLAIRVNTAGAACLILGILSVWARKKENTKSDAMTDVKDNATEDTKENGKSKKLFPISSILKGCQWICALPLLWYAEVAYTVAIWNYDTYYNLTAFLTGYFVVMVIFAVLTIIAWGWQKINMLSICGGLFVAAFTCMIMTLIAGLYISGFFM